MDILLQDLRFAFRSLRRSPGFTVIVVAVMALGIGVNTMTFSMVYGLMARPWPLPGFDRVATVVEQNHKLNDNSMGVSWRNFEDLRERAKSLEHVAGFWNVNALVTLDRDPERFDGTVLTSDVLPALAVVPQAGRNFTRDENVFGQNWSSVMISDRVWRERYHADRDVIGRTLRMNGRTRTIVGVMPRGFRWPELSDFFIPAAVDPNDARNRDDHLLQIVARLRPGVSMAQAQAEMRTLYAQFSHDNPATMKDISIQVEGFADHWRRNVRVMMMVMSFGVGFVLLIACANVANLMLARTMNRRREISVRLALGASRGRVVRQLLTESAVVSLLGAMIGIVLAHWGNRLWISAIPLELPFWMRFQIDTPVLAFAVAISTFAAVAFGLGPALHASDARLGEALREGSAQAGSGRGRQVARSALVVAEVALSLVLLIGAGLMIRSFYKLIETQNQVRAEGVLTARTLLPVATWPSDSARGGFFDKVMPQVSALAGVVSASLTSVLPLNHDSDSRRIVAETGPHADPDHRQLTMFTEVNPGYFRTLGIPVRTGRDFSEQDGPGAPPVAIVNESLAKLLWPGQDPLGKRLKPVNDDRKLGWRTVVGVVADVQQDIEGFGDDSKITAGLFVAHRQEPDQYVTWVLRTNGDPTSLAPPLRALLRANAPEIPLQEVRTMSESIHFSLWTQRLFISLMGVFATLALVIAGVGLYGVMAYSVAQRTHEIGIRMALGAARQDVVRMVVGQAMRLTLFGAGLGFAAAYALTRFMASILFGVSPTDPPTFAGVAIILLASGLLAAWVPAVRATRVDPMRALRTE